MQFDKKSRKKNDSSNASYKNVSNLGNNEQCKNYDQEESNSSRMIKTLRES